MKNIFQPLSNLSRVAVVATAFVLAVPMVHALPINVTVDSSGDLMNGVGVANATEYGQGNNNPTSNLTFLTDVVGNYNDFNSDLPMPTSPVAFDAGSLNVSSYTTIGGYDYVVFHFGAGQAQYAEIPAWIPAIYVPPVYKRNGDLKTAGYTIPGHFADPQWEKSQSGWWAAYYIGGMEGLTFSVPIPGPDEDYLYNGKQVGGFSSARYYNPHVAFVPEGALPISMFGAVLIALALISRRQRR